MSPDHEIDPPVPLDVLRRASAELLFERHVGVPLRHITAELMTEVAERITTAVTELDALIACHQPHPDGGMGYTGDGHGEISPACGACGTPDEYATPWPCHHHQTLTRIRRTLTGEDRPDA